MENDFAYSVTQRIINAACTLFVERGFSNTSLTNVGEFLNVDDSFIRKYYNSTGAIATAIMDDLLKGVEQILDGFTRKELIPLLSEKKITIRKSHAHFHSAEAVNDFLQRLADYQSALLDYFVVRQSALRVVVYAAMTVSQYRDTLHRLMQLFVPGGENPIYADYPQIVEIMAKTHFNAQSFLQTNVEPMIFYAAFIANAVEGDNTGTSEAKARVHVVSLIQQHNARFVQGNDIMFRTAAAAIG